MAHALGPESIHLFLRVQNDNPFKCYSLLFRYINIFPFLPAMRGYHEINLLLPIGYRGGFRFYRTILTAHDIRGNLAQGNILGSLHQYGIPPERGHVRRLSRLQNKRRDEIITPDKRVIIIFTAGNKSQGEKKNSPKYIFIHNL